MKVVNVGKDNGVDLYAIRRFTPFGGVEYFDSSNTGGFWCGTGSRFFKDCVTADKEYLEEYADQLKRRSFWWQLKEALGYE